MSLPWRVKALAARCNSVLSSSSSTSRVGGRGSSSAVHDACMILSALSELKVRTDAVAPVCFKCCVIVASAVSTPSKESGVASTTMVEVLAALASLQARRIPVVQRVLYPKLKELPANTSAKTLQRAALASVRLGNSGVSGAAVEHLAVLILDAYMLNPADHGLLLGLCGLLPLLPCWADPVDVIRQGISDRGQLIADCLESAQTQSLRQRTRFLVTKRPVTLLLWILRELSPVGVQEDGVRYDISRAAGNQLFHLLQLWLPMAALRVVLVEHHDSVPAGSGRQLGSVGECLALVRDVTCSVSLSRCVPGGFAGYFQDHINDFVKLACFQPHADPRSDHVNPKALSAVAPFLRRLFFAAADPVFSKAFNSYDAAKLSDAIHSITNLQELMVVQSSLSDSSNARGTSTTFGDLIVAVLNRIVKDIDFFSKSQRATVDGVLVCSALRSLAHVGNACGAFTKVRRGEAVSDAHNKQSACVTALLEMESSVCRSAFSSDIMVTWPTSLLARALLSLVKLLRCSQLLPKARALSGALSTTERQRTEVCAAVGAVLTRACGVFSDAKRSEALPPRDAVQMLYACALLCDVNSTQQQHSHHADLTGGVFVLPKVALDELTPLAARTAEHLLRLPWFDVRHPQQPSTTSGADTWSGAVAEEWRPMLLTCLEVFLLAGQQDATSLLNGDSLTRVHELVLRFVEWCSASLTNASAASVDSLIEALTRLWTWSACTERSIQQRCAVVSRQLWHELLQAPPGTVSEYHSKTILCVLAANRRALLVSTSSHATGVVAASTVVRSEVVAFWKTHVVSSFMTPLRSQSELQGKRRPFGRLVCDTLDALTDMGFTVVCREHDGEAASKNRRVVLPLQHVVLLESNHHHHSASMSRLSPAPSLQLSLHDVCHIAVNVANQRTRMTRVEWDDWGSALSPLIVRGTHLMTYHALLRLLRAVRSPQTSQLLLPEPFNVSAVIARCSSLLLGDVEANGATSDTCRMPLSLQVALLAALGESDAWRRVDSTASTPQTLLSLVRRIVSNPAVHREDMLKLAYFYGVDAA